MKLSYSGETIDFFVKGDFDLEAMAEIGNSLSQMQVGRAAIIRDLVDTFASLSNIGDHNGIISGCQANVERNSVKKVIQTLRDSVEKDIRKSQDVLSGLDELLQSIGE